MPVSMRLATELSLSKKNAKRVLLDEPFTAINTTDAFVADKRTVEILRYIFRKFKIKERYGVQLILSDLEEEWADKNKDYARTKAFED